MGNKSDLLRCLPVDNTEFSNTPIVDAEELDGAAIVQMLNTGTARTFQEYANLVFTPFELSQLETANRVDMVWDVYVPNGLKIFTLQNRGKGIRRQVVPRMTIPRH